MVSIDDAASFTAYHQSGETMNPGFLVQLKKMSSCLGIDHLRRISLLTPVKGVYHRMEYN